MAEAVILLAVKKISIALGNEAISQASSRFTNFVTQIAELHGSMTRISRELRFIHGFLCKMDVRNRNDQAYEIWVEETRKLAHGIEDIVDEYLHLVRNGHDIGWTFYITEGFKKPKVLLSLNRIISLIKEAEASLVHLFQVKERWVPMANAGQSNDSGYIVERSQYLASASRSISGDLVGIEQNKETLLNWLRNDGMALSTIVLHGMGGLGKTALAANVYKEEREYYDCHAWISVSQTNSPVVILRKLLVELFQGEENLPSKLATMDMIGIQEALGEFLKEKKYLIVLDDVWTSEALNYLSGALVQNLKGSRVVITTRIANVAMLASKERVLTIDCLSEAKSWELFCKKAFQRETDHDCPADLKAVSEKIVMKCKGLPLAIVSVGSLLSVREKNLAEWKRINNQLSWEMTNNPGLDDVRNILYLSFIYLPTYLKSCFLYCTMFPEDYTLRRKVLMRLWIAEGFIEERGESTLEEVAEGYLVELVHRNMLQILECNSFGRIRSCKMHDIVRELAIDLSRKESFGIAFQYQNHGVLDKDTRRLAIVKSSNDIFSSINLPHLRSCKIFDETMPSSRILHSLSAKSKYIAVLELRGLPIEKVPDAVGCLFNLRYFGLRHSKVKFLPKSIEKLSNLETLDVFNSYIQELPPGIVKLKNLRHLLVERVSDPSWRAFRSRHGMHIPKGLLNLTNLQTLHAIEAQDQSIKDLGELSQLRTLRVWNIKGTQCERLSVSLHRLQFLYNMHIAMCDENEVLRLNMLNSPLPNLEKLCLRGKLDEGTLESSLFQTGDQKLRALYLIWSQLKEDPLPCISRLHNLTQLNLTRTCNGDKLIFRSGWFPNLKFLLVRDLPNLLQLVIQEGAMESIQTLQLAHLDKLKDVPLGIELLTSLQRLSFLHVTEDFLMLLNQCSRIQHIRWWYSTRNQPLSRK